MLVLLLLLLSMFEKSPLNIYIYIYIYMYVYVIFIHFLLSSHQTFLEMLNNAIYIARGLARGPHIDAPLIN